MSTKMAIVKMGYNDRIMPLEDAIKVAAALADAREVTYEYGTSSYTYADQEKCRAVEVSVLSTAQYAEIQLSDS